jgi:23S rRNA (uracil1939-C5)-methyltransferase
LQIILASKSPRRRELLKKVLRSFRVVPSGFDETTLTEKDPVRFAVAAAAAKAREVGARFPGSLIIAADTIVTVDGAIFGKPKDRDDARAMLKRLSGRDQLVITGVALYKKDEERLLTGQETTRVRFKPLGDAEVEAYLDTGDYADKAGSYAVQEVGDAFVEVLDGDYDNVVGLPVARVRALFDEFVHPEASAAITDIAFPNDWGVGTLKNGPVVFVPRTVPGDRARVKILRARKKLRYGRLLELEEASPFRIDPPCPHFDACGGCAFQNLAYPKQLEFKERYLRTTLRRIGRLAIDDDAFLPIIPSPDIFGYRNKMEFSFGEREGVLGLGLRERASPFGRYERRTIPLGRCLIFGPAAERILPAAVDWARDGRLNAFDPRTGTGDLRNLVVRDAKATGEVMAILVTRSGAAPDLAGLARVFESRTPEVRSLWWAETDRASDVVELDRIKPIAGAPLIEDRIAGLSVRISPASFVQPNPGAAALVYGMILDQARQLGSRRVLGLYCGPGSIELVLARAVDEVVGIDSEAANIAAAEDNARANGVRNARFIRGRVEDVLRGPSLGRFDTLVIDPPRAGISPRGLKLILSLDVPRLVYLSCNPAALARDLGLLGDRGYHPTRIRPVDFFPHTPHLETLAVLENIAPQMEH